MRFFPIGLCFSGFLLLAACSAGHTAAPPAPAPATNGATAIPRNAVVLWQRQLLASGTTSLVDAMRGQVRNMAIQRSGRCPVITLRGERTILGPSNPLIYVDGAQVTDTCALELIRTYDVQRVELYPSGITTRPGYGSSPFGLILVFLTGRAS